MSADHKITVRQQLIGEASEHLSLQRLRKVGKRDIAAKDEVEMQSWCLGPQVLVQELKSLAMLSPHAEERPNLVERFFD